MPVLLLAVPVALCAIRFGLRGGILFALLGVGVATGSYLVGSAELGLLGYVSQARALLVVGGGVGHFADRRRRLEEQIRRHEELSLDLICTADFDGYFTRVNPGRLPQASGPP